MKARGVQAYFESKARYAEEEINKDFLVLGLTYAIRKKNLKGTGLYVVTKARSENQKIVAVGRIPLMNAPITHVVPFIMAGTGNHAEFGEIVMASKHYVADIISSIGGAEILSADNLIYQISKEMRNKFENGKKSYGLEILLASMLSGEVEMYRLKYDGNFHPCRGFAVIGGYEKQDSRGKSKRKSAIDLISPLYQSRRLPSERTVKKLALRILGEPTEKEELVENHFVMV